MIRMLKRFTAWLQQWPELVWWYACLNVLPLDYSKGWNLFHGTHAKTFYRLTTAMAGTCLMIRMLDRFTAWPQQELELISWYACSNVLPLDYSKAWGLFDGTHAQTFYRCVFELTMRFNWVRNRMAFHLNVYCYKNQGKWSPCTLVLLRFRRNWGLLCVFLISKQYYLFTDNDLNDAWCVTQRKLI